MGQFLSYKCEKSAGDFGTFPLIILSIFDNATKSQHPFALFVHLWLPRLLTKPLPQENNLPSYLWSETENVSGPVPGPVPRPVSVPGPVPVNSGPDDRSRSFLVMVFVLFTSPCPVLDHGLGPGPGPGPSHGPRPNLVSVFGPGPVTQWSEIQSCVK